MQTVCHQKYHQKYHQKDINDDKENPAITTLAMADKIKVNKRTILRHLERLKLDGKIERIGSTKKGYWQAI